MKKITFQGEYWAYSHLACTEAFSDLEPIPCRTFESALGSVRAGDSDLAMIPVENSVAGRVADIHYLLGDYDLKIYSEHFQKVEHQLLVTSGVYLKDVKCVRSHSMAIGKCQSVIKDFGLQTIFMADTAGKKAKPYFPFIFSLFVFILFLLASFARFLSCSIPKIFLNPKSLNGFSATPSLLPTSIIYDFFLFNLNSLVYFFAALIKCSLNDFDVDEVYK